MQLVRQQRANIGNNARLTFEASYREHYERMLRVCLRIGAGNVQFAEDVTHDAFLILYRRLMASAPPADIGGWLYRVTINAALRRLRRDRSLLRRLGQLFFERSEPVTPASDLLFERQETLAAFCATLEALPDRERVVIAMKLFDGQSQQEIAEILSYSKGYVSKLVSRACARLRQRGWDVEHE
jgi:RNA polymerase sigma-70 factor (ECF subfamily)